MAAQTLTAEAAALADHGLYQRPDKFCDIIMKGGITSGVVYPLAVCELAREYQFKSIGGASAGAIAAAATAAAEYGRGQPSGGFKAIAELPEWIGSGQNLFNLFQPQPATKGLFRVAVQLIDKRPFRLLRLLWAAIVSFPIPALVGLLPGVVLGVAAASVDGWQRVVGLVAAVLLGLLLLALALGYGFARKLMLEVPKNLFGMCSGYAPYIEGKPEALTTWMTRYYNTLAGRDPEGDPVTFRDLWGTDEPETAHEIDLALMTTSLTQGRAYQLPFRESGFYFNEADFRRLFPSNVVDWMKAHARETSRPQPGLIPLPEAADLPIVVAARMSLSFPILMSAVPLYRIDFSLPVTSETERVAEVVWFSDGGITSNFPVHFFDRPLPRWPTFGINLRGFQRGRTRSEQECENVFFPTSNRQGILEWWSRFDAPEPSGALSRIKAFFWPSTKPVGDFLGSIKSTMQNAGDNAQMRQAGYRDRVVHVSLGGDEGGMNLSMPAWLLGRLSERGRCAGEALRTQFDWENHRWVRYRASMDCLERLLESVHRGYQYQPEPGTHGNGAGADSFRTYQELVERAIGTPPLSYPWASFPQQHFAAQETLDLAKLAARWADAPEDFDDNAPSPPLDFRMMPRL